MVIGAHTPRLADGGFWDTKKEPKDFGDHGAVFFSFFCSTGMVLFWGTGLDGFQFMAIPGRDIDTFAFFYICTSFFDLGLLGFHGLGYLTGFLMRSRSRLIEEVHQ